MHEVRAGRDVSIKVDWEARLCPGGCGEVHRECCDSVILQDHQTSCPFVAWWRRAHGLDKDAARDVVDEAG